MHNLIILFVGSSLLLGSGDDGDIFVRDNENTEFSNSNQEEKKSEVYPKQAFVPMAVEDTGDILVASEELTGD